MNYNKQAIRLTFKKGFRSQPSSGLGLKGLRGKGINPKP